MASRLWRRPWTASIIDYIRLSDRILILGRVCPIWCQSNNFSLRLNIGRWSEINYPIICFISVRFNGGLIVRMTNLDLSDCHTKNTESYHAVCEFLYKANNRNPLIPGSYYGRVLTDHTFMLKTYLPMSFTLKIGRFRMTSSKLIPFFHFPFIFRALLFHDFSATNIPYRYKFRRWKISPAKNIRR